MPPQSAEFDTSSNGSVINLAGLPVDKLSAKITPVSTASVYPELRYMGSKRRLLPWIFEILSQLEFKSVADPFSGSGCVAYLLKCMGKRVHASDFLAFPTVLARATIENSRSILDGPAIKRVLSSRRNAPSFIQDTFRNIFYTAADLAFLDRVSANIERLKDPYQMALAFSALIRSCLKKQPRGVFTVAGKRYDDGRRDLRLTIEEHFLEQVQVFNATVFDNGEKNTVLQADVADIDLADTDLVYLDPPYVPRADDNDYIKRYHFLEGLVSYWKGLEIMADSKVKKIRKRYTPFSYRRTAEQAFDDLFGRFQKSHIVLSYSSNGFPDLPVLTRMLERYKRHVVVHERAHRYHFGTHDKVFRSQVQEYLIVGS
jgi:adenine-specific DNA-methyltransferase